MPSFVRSSGIRATPDSVRKQGSYLTKLSPNNLNSPELGEANPCKIEANPA